MKYKILFIVLNLIIYCESAWGQSNPIYENLPVGKYAVGFKIITLTDETRVMKSAYNYLGEKNEGDLSRKISVHLWYPAQINAAKRKITYGEYCYNHLLTTTNESISDSRKNTQLNSRRGSVRGWFGAPTDEAWGKLIATPMLAQSEPIAMKEKFPLLIGTLRSLSTSVTNELLASNGYVVAMVTTVGGEGYTSFADGALKEIPDMQFVINYLTKSGNIDKENIATFGFSGSGFVQVLFAMSDYRIKALADIESGIYMEGLFQGLSASNYYNPVKLKVPFLHIFSRDLSQQEKYISEFETKGKFSKRYRLLLNQPALHHWDFASEGYTSCVLLKNRGTEQSNIQKSYEIASFYLLNFFNAELKSDSKARNFLTSKPTLPEVTPSLWDFSELPAVKPAPSLSEFENIIRTKGITQALTIVNNTLKNDSSTNLLQGFGVNSLGYTFINEKKYEEAIGVFKLNAELHPDAANWIDSLAEGYEISGDTENTKKISQQILDLLSQKSTLTDSEKSLKDTAEGRLKR